MSLSSTKSNQKFFDLNYIFFRSSAKPAVWKGEVNMPGVAEFGVTAHQGK